MDRDVADTGARVLRTGTSNKQPVLHEETAVAEGRQFRVMRHDDDVCRQVVALPRERVDGTETAASASSAIEETIEEAL